MAMSPALELDSASRVTAVYIGRVGDVITATPFLRALRRRLPKARIRLVVGWRSREVLPLIPFIDASLILGKPWRLDAHLALAARLLSSREDLLVDLNSVFSKTSTLLARATPARAKLAFEKGKGPAVFTHALAAPAVEEHMAERYGRLAAALGAPYVPELELSLPSADAAQAERLLEPFALESGRFKIAIHAGNFDRFSFRWQEEKFAALADRLAADPGFQVFFLAGPGEKEKTRAVAAAMKRPAPVLPTARLGVTGGMLRRMDLFVCNVTGTTHLAAALGVPTFAFYAGYTQTVWRPRGERHGGTLCPEWQTCRDTTVDEACAALKAHVARLRDI
ncbi:MAG: glycosyltransferase family 9 protein [Elusimicrobia bacterium]|nr:glycosyltransferase family 9 protein [Elusimicrobiota bacterium]